jgi:hypothetical protein
VRAGRALLAAGARTGLDRRMLRDLVSVCVPETADPAQVADELPTQRLVDALGLGPLHAAIGVANPSPNRKPTLQLFAPNGSPAAFVKVGWNELTRSMVDNEADALARLSAAGVEAPQRPSVLRTERWHDMVMLATEPMPLGIRRQPAGTCPPLDLSAVRSEVGELAHTPFWQRLRVRLAELGAEACEPDEPRIVAAAVDRVEAVSAGRRVTSRAWHGDWVHWNMATHQGQLWAWDWEHFADDAPACFDQLHFWFQDEFVIRRRTFADAMAHATGQTAAARAAAYDDRLGAVIPLTYALEMYLRTARMARLGADWEARFHAPAVGWIASATAAS